MNCCTVDWPDCLQEAADHEVASRQLDNLIRPDLPAGAEAGVDHHAVDAEAGHGLTVGSDVR